MLETRAFSCDSLFMSAIEATAEVFVTAFKSLKPRQREAVLERMLADDKLKLSVTMKESLALESRRHQPRKSFRWSGSFRRPSRARDELATTRQLTNEFDAKEWQW